LRPLKTKAPVRLNVAEMPSQPSSSGFEYLFNSAMRSNWFAKFMVNNHPHPNTLPHCTEKMPYNTHRVPQDHIIREAAELYVVLSIIPTL
jgi:hypothetical protein